ncbi:MAG: quinone-dependent dihydroorotate dehydrogenase [Shimia sp.]
MKLTDRAALAVLHRFDPEVAHGLAIRALRMGLGPRVTVDKGLSVTIAGLTLPSPIGLAAGFDKNAEAIEPLARCGFGFLEVGAATPRPQPGNPKPRLFRLSEDRAVINRFGFNNQGMEAIADRLSRYQGIVPLGINLGANKDSTDRAADYASVLRHTAKHVDFATINVSSPNTERLRDLQGRDALAALLETVADARGGLTRPLPLFLKIAPDLSPGELADVAEVAGTHGVDGIIATNTTLSRDGLRSSDAGEKGGLSGAPLFEKSTRILAQLSTLTDLPLIGVGGVAGAEDAYAKIRAGASAVQLYSALTYRGLGLVGEITRGLRALLKRDGFTTVAEAVGTDRERWL